MTTSIENKSKPCLVKARQGFSVEYKDRLLYSKYAPEKNMLQVVERLEVLSGTLILCVSPALGLGLDALFAKLPKNCALIGVEADAALFEFSRHHCKELECARCGAFELIAPNMLPNLPIYLNSRVSKWRGVFKRVIRIDCSAGASFYADFYGRLSDAIQDSIAQFWKNRVTLVKFGRRYSRNFLQNLCMYSECGGVDELFGKIKKPILVLGAGAGLENALSLPKEYLSSFFIIAVDAAFSALKTLDIHIDAVVCEESQSVIAECFTGGEKTATFTICSLSSYPRVAKEAGKRGLFYTTLFDDLEFIESAKNAGILPPILPPLGSVGLAAVYLALQFRRWETIPVTIFGLDFSFSLGKTHARGSAQHIKRLRSQNKIRPVENYGAHFCEGAFFAADKNGETTTTTVALSGYATVFRNYFYGVKNLFDGGSGGLDLGLPRKELAVVKAGGVYTTFNQKNEDGFFKERGTDDIVKAEKKRAIHDYLAAEKKTLQDLKDILSGKTKLLEAERNKKIQDLLSRRDYLFFHFPDGIRPRLDQNFLNRVRAELDGFLKIIGMCL